MSKKHNRWAFLRPRASARELLAQMALSVSLWSSKFHRNTSGRVSMRSVGYGLAVAGAVLAIVAFVGAVFIPVATIPLLDWEIAALFGAILLVVAVVVHAAD